MSGEDGQGSWGSGKSTRYRMAHHQIIVNISREIYNILIIINISVNTINLTDYT